MDWKPYKIFFKQEKGIILVRWLKSQEVCGQTGECLNLLFQKNTAMSRVQHQEWAVEVEWKKRSLEIKECRGQTAGQIIHVNVEDSQDYNWTSVERSIL